MLDQITPVLLSCNEESNIGRALAKLTWAKDIVLVDSGSSDDTVNIASSYRHVRIFFRPFDTHRNQWLFAVSQTQIRSPWILRLDADYILSDELIEEFSNLNPDASVDAFRVAFDYAVCGRKLSGSLYPPNTVLFRANKYTVVQGGHTDRWIIAGEIRKLQNRILHDDRKPLSHWIAAQQRYAKLEAEHLLSKLPSELSGKERLRLSATIMPLLAMFFVLISKRCIFDGAAGWLYALQRMIAEAMIGAEIIHRRLNRNDKAIT